MRTLRLYAAPLMLVAWAVTIDVIGNSQPVVVIRLLSMAVAVTVTVREAVRVNGERKRKRGR